MTGKPALHVPTATGCAALAQLELDHVPWHELAHAYGRGPTMALDGDVRRALELLADEQPTGFRAGMHALFSSVCHQGTIYEVTAYVVPFLAALLAGLASADACDADEVRMTRALLTSIAHASSFDAPHGSHAGAWGEGVGAATRASFRASDAHLTAIAAVDPSFVSIHAALRELGAIADGVVPAELVSRLDTLASDD